MNTTITTKKIQTISLSLLIFMAAMTINSSMQTSSIFADDDNDDELEGEVGEEGEVIAKLVANGDNNNNNKNVLAPAAAAVKNTQTPIVPAAEAQQQQPPAKPAAAAPTAAEEEQQDKGMKLVLGDIVLPINQKSDFSLELPFSKIVVEPIK